MDINHMSTAALQMKLREILRENENLKNDIKTKESKIEELTNFLDHEGYDENDVNEYIELRKYDFDTDVINKEYETISTGTYNNPTKLINGVAEKPPVKERLKGFVREFDWDYLIPIGFVTFAAIGIIIAILCGEPL